MNIQYALSITHLFKGKLISGDRKKQFSSNQRKMSTISMIKTRLQLFISPLMHTQTRFDVMEGDSRPGNSFSFGLE